MTEVGKEQSCCGFHRGLFVKYRVQLSLLSQLLNKFMQIKAEALGHRTNL